MWGYVSRHRDTSVSEVPGLKPSSRRSLNGPTPASGCPGMTAAKLPFVYSIAAASKEDK
jgi:hypothetical protein